MSKIFKSILLYWLFLNFKRKLVIIFYIVFTETRYATKITINGQFFLDIPHLTIRGDLILPEPFSEKIWSW